MLSTYRIIPAMILFLASCLSARLVDSLLMSSKTSVAVWDDVLSDESRQTLHQVASQQGSSQHYLFSRPIDPNSSGKIEKALDSILTEIGDDSKYIEFWTRQEWRSIEAHADVDELLAKRQDAEDNSDQNSYRFPTNGHVLYLQRGSEVRGPTCVFPGRRSGGDLLRQRSREETIGGVAAEELEVVIVPAVPGRLLRFQGDYLHTVPRPHDLWFRKFIKGAPKYSPEDEWGRSVILFNTWGNDPPLDVPAHLTENNEEKEKKHFLSEARTAWSEVYFQTESDNDQGCQTTYDDSEWVAAKIWLLGNERRRDHPMRTLEILSPKTLRTALEEESTVSRFLLKQA
jgi:hypothetical protein